MRHQPRARGPSPTMVAPTWTHGTTSSRSSTAIFAKGRIQSTRNKAAWRSDRFGRRRSARISTVTSRYTTAIGVHAAITAAKPAAMSVSNTIGSGNAKYIVSITK